MTDADHTFAERAVIGRMLFYPELIEETALYVDAEDFGDAVRRAAFTSMHALKASGEPVEIASVGQRMLFELTFEAELVDHRRVLAELVEAGMLVTGQSNFEYYAKLVSSNGRLRKLRSEAKSIAEAEGKGVEDVLALYETAVKNAQRPSTEMPEPIGDILGRRYNSLERESQGLIEIPRAFTGLHCFDRQGGLRGGEFWVLGGRPGSGKTALTWQIGETSARGTTHRRPVLFFSLEMSKEELAERTFSRAADVAATDLRAGKVADASWTHLHRAVASFDGTPLLVVDEARFTIEHVGALCSRIAARGGLSLVIIDYVQLLRTRMRFDQREQQVSFISRELKAIARTLNVPVLGLAQLNRAVESRSNHTPQMSDLRETGSLEQDADVVAFIHRPYLFDSTADPAESEIHFAKNRHGPTGRVQVRFIADRSTFVDG